MRGRRCIASSAVLLLRNLPLETSFPLAVQPIARPEADGMRAMRLVLRARRGHVPQARAPAGAGIHVRLLCTTSPTLRIIHRRGERDVVEYTSGGAKGIQAAGTQAESGMRFASPTDVAAAAAAYLLPKGFPASVGADYVGYSSWCAAATVCMSAGGVLSTQSLLCAVGVGQAQALPLAASLNWVLKDGIGQFAAVLSAAVISDRFDADPKRWRAVAAYAEACARCLNASTPFAPWAFLPIASAANLGYSVACLAASATKADFHRSLTRRQNLGDLTGKAGSQAITASLVGTALGLCVSAAAVTTPAHALAGCVFFTAAQLLAIERAMQALALPTLTPAVGAHLLSAHLDAQRLPTPAQFAQTQRHLTAPLTLARGYEARSLIRLGSPSLLELAPDAAALQAARSSCEGAAHLLRVEPASGRGEVRVLLLEGAAASDVLLALLHAGLVERGVVEAPGEAAAYSAEAVRERLREAQAGAAAFAVELQEAGWDVSSAHKLEEAPSRLALVEQK